MSEQSEAVAYEAAKAEFEKANDNYLLACSQYRGAAKKLNECHLALKVSMKQTEKIPHLPEYVEAAEEIND